MQYVIEYTENPESGAEIVASLQFADGRVFANPQKIGEGSFSRLYRLSCENHGKVQTLVVSLPRGCYQDLGRDAQEEFVADIYYKKIFFNALYGHGAAIAVHENNDTPPLLFLFDIHGQDIYQRQVALGKMFMHNEYFDLRTIYSVALAAAHSLKKLHHGAGLVNCDLKTDNFMRDQHGFMLMIDGGASREVNARESYYYVNAKDYADTLVHFPHHDPKLFKTWNSHADRQEFRTVALVEDYYAFGEMMNALMRRSSIERAQKVVPAYEHDLLADWYQLMQACKDSDPIRRPLIDDIIGVLEQLLNRQTQLIYAELMDVMANISAENLNYEPGFLRALQGLVARLTNYFTHDDNHGVAHEIADDIAIFIFRFKMTLDASDNEHIRALHEMLLILQQNAEALLPFQANTMMPGDVFFRTRTLIHNAACALLHDVNCAEYQPYLQSILRGTKHVVQGMTDIVSLFHGEHLHSLRHMCEAFAERLAALFYHYHDDLLSADTDNILRFVFECYFACDAFLAEFQPGFTQQIISFGRSVREINEWLDNIKIIRRYSARIMDRKITIEPEKGNGNLSLFDLTPLRQQFVAKSPAALTDVPEVEEGVTAGCFGRIWG